MPGKPAHKVRSTTQLLGTANIPSKASLLCRLTTPWSVHMYYTMSYTGGSQDLVYLSVMQAVGLERQDLSRTYLTHHELENDVVHHHHHHHHHCYCYCYAGRYAASIGGRERALEGQEAGCQEGGCSPASSCLQVCTTHNFCTLGNPEWTSNLRITCCSLSIIWQNDV